MYHPEDPQEQKDNVGCPVVVIFLKSVQVDIYHATETLVERLLVAASWALLFRMRCERGVKMLHPLEDGPKFECFSEVAQ